MCRCDGYRCSTVDLNQEWVNVNRFVLQLSHERVFSDDFTPNLRAKAFNIGVTRCEVRLRFLLDDWN